MLDHDTDRSDRQWSLPDSTTSATAEEASRLRQQDRSLELIMRQDVVRLTLSLGIDQLKPHGEGWQDLLSPRSCPLSGQGAGGNQWKISES